MTRPESEPKKNSGSSLAFELSPEQARLLREWCERTSVVDEDDPLPSFTVAFTFTGVGTQIMACRCFHIPEGTPQIVLQELL